MFSLFYSAFTSEYVYAVFMLFLSSECVSAVHGSFTSEYVYAVLCYFSRANVFTLFYVIFLERMCLRCLWYFHERMCFRCVYAVMVPSRANVSSLFMLFFSCECVYAVYGTFTSEYVYYVIFSHAEVFTLGYV